MRRLIWLIGIVCLIGAALYIQGTPFSNQPMVKIGVLSLNEDRLEKFEGLKDKLQTFNYEEGKNIVFEVLTGENNLAQLDWLAEQLVAGEFEVLVAAGAGETRALTKATAKLKEPPPIIFMGTLSPLALGLVKNEAFPTTNVTGVNNYHYELTVKRLELLKRLMPQVTEVAVLGDRHTTLYQDSQSSLRHTAQGLSINYTMFDLSEEKDIPRIVEQMAKTNQAILIMSGSLLETHTEAIARCANAKGLPVFGVYPSDVQKGCIASYGTSYYSQGAQAAHMVHKALMGYSAAQIPVETPEKFGFTVNLKVAYNLGITLDESYLCFADHVIGLGGNP